MKRQNTRFLTRSRTHTSCKVGKIICFVQNFHTFLPFSLINHNLPSDMDAKPTSSNYKKFVARHGTKVVELDACPVKLLQSTLRERIDSVIDVQEFNRQLELEKEDAAHVEAHRRIVFEAIGGRHGL